MENEAKSENDTLTEQASRLTVHGTTDLVKATNKFARVFWAILLVFGILGAGRGVYLIVTEYLETPILTSYTVKHQSPKFPDIYLCPRSPINIQKTTTAVNNRGIGFDYLHTADDGTLLGSQTKIWDGTDKYQSNEGGPFEKLDPDADVEEPLPITKYFLEVGFDVTQMIRRCSFNHNKINCDSIIKRRFDKDYGMCFLVQLGERGQNSPGIGLQLVIDLRSDLRSFHPLSNGIGVRINDIFDPTETTAKELLINAGGMTQLSINPTFLSLMNYKSKSIKQECRELEEAYQFQVLQNLQYSLSACRMDCVQKVVNEVCECSLPLDELYLQLKYRRPCNSSAIENCYFKRMIKNNEDEEKVNECTKECLMPCERWKYQHQVSFIPFSSEPSQLLGVDKNLTSADFERINNDFIVLDIALNKIQYTEITQSNSMTLVTFLSNIGGQLGLWLGASVLSLVQIIGLVMFCCCDLVKWKGKKK